MSVRTDSELLNDIISSIEKIESYCSDMSYSDFLKDNKTQDAVIRNIEIIGEASGRVTDDFKLKNNNIPWIKIKGTRNRLVHDYSGLNLDILWNIIKDDLPNLYLLIKNI